MFLGQAHDTRFHAGGPRVFEDQHFVDMTPAMLRQMIEEIRQAIIRQERLRNEITQLEGADPER
jgi:hypothetical protein